MEPPFDVLILADRLATLGRLVSSLTHELNNPLATIIGNLDLARTDLDALNAGGASVAAIRESVDEAHAAAARARALVRGLRLLAPASTTPRPIDVREVLDAGLLLVAHEIRHRARLVKSYEDVPPVLATDEQLGHLILALLMNAVQAIPAGAAASNEIRVRASSEGDAAIVEIVDTGPGMPPDVQQRAFDLYYTTQPGGAAGLGLPVAREVARRLGGEVSLSSQPGGGSAVRVRLPGVPGTSVTPTHTPPGEAATPARRRILVIDDEPALCRVIARILGSRHEVVVATSGREAQDVLGHDAEFDLLLCDLSMADVSGPDLYEWLARERPRLVPRVAFMTGNIASPEANAFLSRVGNPRLEKPIAAAVLRDFVARFVPG